MKFATKNLMMAGALVAALGAADAQALTSLTLNANTINAARSGTDLDDGTFDTGDVFTVTLSDQSLSNLTLSPDGTPAVVLDNGDADGDNDFTLAGTLNMLVLPGNKIETTGGSFVITSLNGADTDDTYSATVSGGGLNGDLVGNILFLSGITFDGAFSDDTFNTVALDEIYAVQLANGSLSGTFTQTTIVLDQPQNSQFQTTVVVPTPAAALGAIPMLGLLAARRRRRNG